MPGLNQNEIRSILPQAYPFLMLDRVEDYQEGERLTAVKNISADEWPFTTRHMSQVTRHTRPGAFPNTLLIEAAAQAALVLYHVAKIKDSGRRPQYFIGKIDSEFFEPAVIGETLRIAVTAGKLLDSGGYANVEITAADAPKAKIELFFSVQ